QPVGDRIQDLSESRNLIQATGEVAVDPVGPSDDEYQTRGQPDPLLAEEDVPKVRDGEEPDERNEVGNREDASVHAVSVVTAPPRIVSGLGRHPGLSGLDLLPLGIGEDLHRRRKEVVLLDGDVSVQLVEEAFERVDVDLVDIE